MFFECRSVQSGELITSSILGSLANDARNLFRLSIYKRVILDLKAHLLLSHLRFSNHTPSIAFCDPIE